VTQPAEYHQSVPRELRANLRFRRRLLDRCRDDPGAQASVRAACARDLLFHVNATVWQYNPRKRDGLEVAPFVTWPFQDDALRAMVDAVDRGKDLVIEKSREMGASWMCLLVFDWLWRYRPWQKFLAISRSADAVDNRDDPDSLFWKIDFIHRHTPHWLLPAMKRPSMKFTNLDNGSTLIGQASTGKAGVGGRATAMFVDEFSQIDEAYEVLYRTADTTGCRIFNFTHTDVGNAAAELSRRVDMKKLRLHWSQHPDKNRGLYQYDHDTGKVDVRDKHYEYPLDFHFVTDGKLRSPWYDAECVRRASPRAIAMDLDIDPQGAMSQFFPATTVRHLMATTTRPPSWEGDLVYERDSGRPVELAARPGGPLRLWLVPGAHGRLPRDRYGVGADVSAGTGATPSCLSACSARTGEKVLSWSDPNVDPKDFAVFAVAVCRFLEDASGEPGKMAWEHVGPGVSFGKQVLGLGFRRCHFRTNEKKVGSRADHESPGWYPTPDAKRILLEDYRAALSNSRYVNRDKDALAECLSFRYMPNGYVEHAGESGGDDPAAARWNHGDMTIADALGYKMAVSLGLGEAVAVREVQEVRAGSLAWRRQVVEAAEREAALS
jgi:hypothetical protein